MADLFFRNPKATPYTRVERELAKRAEGLDQRLASLTAAVEFDPGPLDPGPLLGIPISVKDLFGVPGYATFAGSPRPLPPSFEQAGPVVARALEQHAVVVGKTHTVEFAFGGVGTNPHHPTPPPTS